MRLIIVDLTNGLLTDGKLTAARPGAGEALHALSRRYRLAAFVDTDATGLTLRGTLESSGLGTHFETITTSADTGDTLSPVTVHQVAAANGIPTRQTAVISNRANIAETLQMAGIVTLLAGRSQPPSELPEALAWVTAVSSES